MSGAASLVAVLIAAALLGIELWVIAIAWLGWLVTRPVLGPVAVGTAGVALAVSAAIYVAVVVALAALVSP